MEFAYTVLDLVLMGRTAHLGPFSAPGRARSRARAARRWPISASPISPTAEANRISGGQRQLCLVARALAQDAPLLVMDEPTASLDLGNRLLVLERVRALSAQGYGVVFSTHDPDQARELATSVAVIAEGRLAAYGPPRETLTGPILSAVYGVAVMVERNRERPPRRRRLATEASPSRVRRRRRAVSGPASRPPKLGSDRPTVAGPMPIASSVSPEGRARHAANRSGSGTVARRGPARMSPGCGQAAAASTPGVAGRRPAP